MMIQIVLFAMLVTLALYALRQRQRSPVVSVAMIAVIACGIILVLFPDLSEWSASILGVGRGVDLVLYLFVIGALGAIFLLHLRVRAHSEALTAVARETALLAVKHAERD